jgi:hypothetical protein
MGQQEGRPLGRPRPIRYAARNLTHTPSGEGGPIVALPGHVRPEPARRDRVDTCRFGHCYGVCERDLHESPRVSIDKHRRMEEKCNSIVVDRMKTVEKFPDGLLTAEPLAAESVEEVGFFRSRP